MENVVEAKQFLLFAFEQAADRNARPARDDFGDFVGRDLFPKKTRAFPPPAALAFEFFELFFELGNLAVLILRDTPQIALALGAFHFGAGQFQRFANFLNIVDDLLLRVPLGFESIALTLEFGHFLLQRGKAFLRSLVLFLA